MPLAAIAAIGVAGSIGGAAISAHAAGNAAKTQANAADAAAQLQKQAADESLAFQKQEFAQQQANMAPWLQSGAGALANLDYLLGITPASQTGTPVSGPTATSSTLQRPTAPQLTGLGAMIQKVNPNFMMGSAGPVDVAPTTPALGATPSQLVASPNTSLGNFGSLMQPFSEKFQAPTGLTEQNDPGFQARLKLGTDALERSAAARGGVLTGGTGKALENYAQDYASNEYGNVYNRAYNDWATRYNTYNQNQTNQYNRLASLAGVGQQTAQQLGYLGSNAASTASSTLLGSAANIGQQYNNAAAATASGYIGGANAWGNAINSSTNSLTNMYMLHQLGLG